MANKKQKQKAGDGAIQLQIESLTQIINVKNTDITDLLKKKDEENTGTVLSSIEDVLCSNRDFDLLELEKLNSVCILNSSLMPWKRSCGLSFESICNTQYYIDPYVKINSLLSNEKHQFSEIKEKIINQKCIILGNAGYGKSFIIKKTCIDLIHTGRHALYISANDWNNKNVVAKYVISILKKEIIPPNDLLIVFDGIDEVFATEHKELGRIIDEANTVNCSIWFGCRTDYYDSAQCMEAIPYKRIYLQEWEQEQALRYVEEYSKKVKNAIILEKYNQLLQQCNSIESFSKNPLRLSMLVYLFENVKEEMNLHNNEYQLYDAFFSHWINNEMRRLNMDVSNEEQIILKWQEIARKLYVDRHNEILIDNNPILTSILKVSKSTNKNCSVNDFLHRSFIEFLLAKHAVESMLSSPQRIIEALKYNNRSDVDFFIKRAFVGLLPLKKSKIIDNLILSYSMVENASISNNECFYVQNQIVYYLTRMNSNSNRIKSFIEKIYVDETRPIMKQGIAYGAANIGLLDIALDFAKKMDDPNSPENLTNRSWTLIFYGDEPDEDPLDFEDNQNSPWQRSKAARLRRLQGSKDKDKAFRMFDLCILHGFYESRGWNEMSETDVTIINKAETSIKGYNSDIIAFLEKKKKDLIIKFIPHDLM